MIILAIDTSGPVCGVAVWADGRIRYEAAAINKLTHSESLMPMLDEALIRAGVDKKDLTHLAVTVGPGSFTGVRIGVTAVKALSHALNIPCIAVGALEATAAGLTESDKVVCPIQDARVMQVYGAAFQGGKRLLNDCVLKLDEFIAAISPLGEKFLFTGDGVITYRTKLEELLGERAHFADAQCTYLRPAAVACVAAAHADEAVDYLSLQPMYLRAPQAERERAKKEAQHG